MTMILLPQDSSSTTGRSPSFALRYPSLRDPIYASELARRSPSACSTRSRLLSWRRMIHAKTGVSSAPMDLGCLESGLGPDERDRTDLLVDYV